MRLRRIRKDDKLQIRWNMENNANVWLFNNEFSPAIYEQSCVTNPLNAYTLLYYNLKQSVQFSSSFQKVQGKAHNLKLVDSALNFRRISVLSHNQGFKPKTGWKNLNKYDTLAYFIVMLSKERSLSFNNVATVLLLGVLPKLYLHKLINRSSTHYNQKLYNSNFGIPSLNVQKIRHWSKQQESYAAGNGVYSMYSLFLGSLLTS